MSAPSLGRVPDRLRPLGTAVLAGLLIAAAVPPWGWWPAAFVGIALLDRLVADRPVASRFRRGMATGLAWALPSTLWMIDLSPPGWLFAGGVHALWLGLATALVPAGRWRRLGLVGTVTLAELVRWSVPFGGVPLDSIALGQAAGPLAPVVRVAGPLLLVALTVTVGTGLSALVDGRRTGGSAAAAVPVVITLAVATVLAAVAPTGRVVGELDMALVQGGGPQRTRATPTGAATVVATSWRQTATSGRRWTWWCGRRTWATLFPCPNRDGATRTGSTPTMLPRP